MLLMNTLHGTRCQGPAARKGCWWLVSGNLHSSALPSKDFGQKTSATWPLGCSNFRFLCSSEQLVGLIDLTCSNPSFLPPASLPHSFLSGTSSSLICSPMAHFLHENFSDLAAHRDLPLSPSMALAFHALYLAHNHILLNFASYYHKLPYHLSAARHDIWRV